MSTELQTWLNTLRLDQYASVLAAHAIGIDDVIDLTDADLISWGIASADRKRLVEAITALRQSRVGACTNEPDHQAAAGVMERGAERRQISVLFCDIVGSTEIAHRLDPEELAFVMERYHKAASDTIRHLGGYVAQLLGDGVVAYFGWPKVHEDDAERAVAAGLELTASLPRLSTPDSPSLAVRIGIATGLVVVGGETKLGDGLAMGTTPALAARLQAEAEPNSLVIAPLTARLAGRSFFYRSLGTRSMRGLPAPLEVFQVIGRRSTLNRFKASRTLPSTPLIGRTGELEALLALWRQATEGAGQVVLLSGEAGIGKSRLVQAMRERIGRDATVLRYQCSPLHQHTMLFPVIQQLMRSIGISGQQSTMDKLVKVQEWSPPATSDAAEFLPLLCHLLEIKSPDYPLPDVSPEQMRRRTVELLSRRFMELTKDGPVLAIIEDLQWIDPTSEELLVGILDNIERAPVVVVATSRNTFSQGWHVGGYTTERHLEHLSGVDSRRLVDAIAAERLSAEVCGDIVARAGGIPLYLEELTLALLEAGRSGGIGEVPTSLQALLAARLDRMGDARPLLQLGAVFGRQFALADLQTVAARSEMEVSAMVEKAVVSGLLHETTAGDDSVLIFKHALVQDAAYASLLNIEKRRLHSAVLDHLERSDRSALAGAAIVLASHAERGEVWDKAAHYLVEALAQAVQSRAYPEALALYDRALRALKQLPTETSNPFAVRAHLLAFNPLFWMADLDRSLEVVQKAETLSLALADMRQRAVAEGYHASVLWLTGRYETGLQSVETALQLADRLNDGDLRLAARFTHANLVHAQGRLAEASNLYSQLIEDLPDKLDMRRFGWTGTPTVLVRSFLTWSLISLGQFEKAQETMSRAIEQVSFVRDGYSAGFAYLAQGGYQLATFNPKAAIESLERACYLLKKVGTALPISTAFLGAAYVKGGRAGDALALLVAAEKDGAFGSGDIRIWAPYYYIALAQAHNAAGASGLALEAIRRAEEIAEETQALAVRADSLRVRADIAGQDPSATVDHVCAFYQRAIDIGRTCGMRPLIAQCLAGMARSHAGGGDLVVAADYDNRARLIFNKLKFRPYRE
jgi:class 3 adenylate cyclase/tetratricopeptide (TPR) repeat protein